MTYFNIVFGLRYLLESITHKLSVYCVFFSTTITLPIYEYILPYFFVKMSMLEIKNQIIICSTWGMGRKL